MCKQSGFFACIFHNFYEMWQILCNFCFEIKCFYCKLVRIECWCVFLIYFRKLHKNILIETLTKLLNITFIFFKERINSELYPVMIFEITESRELELFGVPKGFQMSFICSSRACINAQDKSKRYSKINQFVTFSWFYRNVIAGSAAVLLNV